MGVGVNGNLIPPQKGEIRNPKGKPPGTKSWSTVIRKLLEDENLEIEVKKGIFKKYPAWVIAEVMAQKAARGDTSAATWLAKYGYGDKVTHELDPGFLNVTKMEIEIVKPRDEIEASAESEATPGDGGAERPATD